MTIELKDRIFETIGKVADSLNYEAYVIGGYVRDLLLNIPNDDIDIVVVGKGKTMAEAYAREIGSKNVQVFENFGTAMVKTPEGLEIEFVGARKESYDRTSRKPVVEEGTLMDDQLRRDFTINAMGICLNKDRYGELMDSFNGLKDLRDKVIRTPTDPDITFSDDPLRQFRAVRFATRLGFRIDDTTYDSIRRNAGRISILSKERITTELNKIMMSPNPRRGFMLLHDLGLLEIVLPEVSRLDIDGEEGIERRHKNIFLHTMGVLDNVAKASDNLWLRWAALLHDIGKIPTRVFKDGQWYFPEHEVKGSYMVQTVFKRLKLPLGKDEMMFVKKMVVLHMRPKTIASLGNITDAAVRRLVFDADGHIDELLCLCEADITTKKSELKKGFLDDYTTLRKRIEELKQKDFVREFQPCLTGDDIMREFSLTPGREVGRLKQIVKDAVLDGTVPNDYGSLLGYLKEKAGDGTVFAKDAN